ncbi:hypothetical protein SAMN05446635_10018 [Burkholderia sp. OK233]|nr:hypothetical protein SAMN05446635_10018 [Burkholderia sp. OK233]
MQSAGNGHAQQLFNWASRSSASWFRTRGVSWTGCGCHGVRPAPAFCSRFARNGTSSSGTSFIQAGAGNPSGVTRTLARAINACHQETVRAREDPAVRLIVHQLAVLCGSLAIDNTLDVYGKLNDQCRVKDAAIKTTRAGANENTPNAV